MHFHVNLKRGILIRCGGENYGKNQKTHIKHRRSLSLCRGKTKEARPETIAKPKKKAQRATQKAAKSDGKINKVRGWQSGLVPPGYRRLTANIPNDLYRKMKVKAAMEDRTIVSILEELLEAL